MKKIFLTVDELLLLIDVREAIGYASQKNLDIVEEHEDHPKDCEVFLSEEDIYDMSDALQNFLEGYLSEEDERMQTLTCLMEKLNATIPEKPADQDEEDYSPNQDWLLIRITHFRRRNTKSRILDRRRPPFSILK